MVVTANDVKNPNTGPAGRRRANGSWTLDRMYRARKIITMAMVIRKTPGLAEFNARTPMGVAATPPSTRPMLARRFK